MAKDPEEPLVAESDDGKKKKKPVLLIGVAALVLVVALFVTNSQDEKKPAAATRAEQKDPDKQTGLPALDVSGPNDKGFVVSFDRRLTDTSQKINQLSAQQQKLQQSVDQRLTEMQNNFDKKWGDLVEKQTATIYSNQHDLRTGVTGNNGGLPPLPGDITMGSATGPAPDKAQPDAALQYISFGPAPGKPQERATLGNLLGDAKSAGKEVATPPDSAKTAKDKHAKDGLIQIPAANIVHAVTLHAVDCPVGKDQQVPVTLAITGPFRGPNGKLVDLGHAHIEAKCVGIAGEQSGGTSRARFYVDRLAYVGPDGSPQTVSIEGYVVDRRDSSEDVAGIFDSKQGTALAKSAAAASLAAIGSLATATQTTNVVSPTTGTTTSSLTGQATTALTGAAVGGAAQRAADYYQNQVEALVPTVHIAADVPVDVFITSPFSVKGSKELADAGY